MKIGLMGGTFNPIHNAHLAMADIFVDTMNLDTCFIVPASVSPFKKDCESNSLIENNDRLEMVQNAIESNEKLILCDFEIKRGGVSYTVDTVKYLLELYPNDELFLLIGTDQALAFNKWKDWEYISDAVTICIVKRPDYDDNSMETINLLFDTVGESPVWVNAPIINITSTIIRERIANGQPISEYVPKIVENIILQRGLYEV